MIKRCYDCHNEIKHKPMKQVEFPVLKKNDGTVHYVCNRCYVLNYLPWKVSAVIPHTGTSPQQPTSK